MTTAAKFWPEVQCIPLSRPRIPPLLSLTGTSHLKGTSMFSSTSTNNSFWWWKKPFLAILRKSEKKKSYTYPSIEICTKSLWGVFGAETTLPLVPPFLCNPADRPANQPYLHHRDNHRKKIDKYYKICTARDWTFCGASSPSPHFLAMPASNAGWLVIWSVRVPYAQTIVHRINPCDFVDL